MTDVPVFMAFPDEALRYQCATCDQRCCKLSALLVFPAERERLVTALPALELVAPPVAGGIEAFATPPSGCWFLKDDRCALVDDDAPADEPRRFVIEELPVVTPIK